jgi:DNA-binding GntR family transcriptional regulator
MQPELAIVRDNNISDAVAKKLREMIVNGELPAGQRINEVKLAHQLGVSRTPLREALNRLANEGALSSVPRIGYSVTPLTLEEFQQVYAIRPILDPEALRLAGLPKPDALRNLERINTRMVRASDAENVIQLDDEFHFALIEACPNKVLLDLIRQIIRRTHRYEITLMRENKNVSTANEEHEEILAALRRGDLEAACSALRNNLLTGYEPIAKWLANR